MKYYNFKRIFDIVFSFTGIFVLLPLLFIVSILIKTDSSGPIIFRQKRIGFKGKVFTIYKFRSMKSGAEKGGVYELKNDKRVTTIGKFIRKTSVDELPQLFNILKGDMSFIGPRPTLTYHPWEYSEYTDEQKKRFDVKPGVSGWAQINGRKDVPWPERIKLDVFYVDNLSFLLDIKILLKTVYKVLTMQDNVNNTRTA